MKTLLVTGGAGFIGGNFVRMLLEEKAVKVVNLDLLTYGSFPHSGFGMGLERFVAWMCGIPHLREASPYPRLINRLYP